MNAFRNRFHVRPALRYGLFLLALVVGLLYVQPASAPIDPPSTDATLSSLAFTPSDITNFRSDGYAYTVDVANATTSVILIPVVNDFAAKIMVNGSTVATGSVGASPEGVTDSSHSPQRDRPGWGVTNEAAVRLPDHALYRAICTKVQSVLVQTTRLNRRLHPRRGVVS